MNTIGSHQLPIMAGIFWEDSPRGTTFNRESNLAMSLVQTEDPMVQSAVITPRENCVVSNLIHWYPERCESHQLRSNFHVVLWGPKKQVVHLGGESFIGGGNSWPGETTGPVSLYTSIHQCPHIG